MGFRVDLTARAEGDLERLFREIDAPGSAAARRWFIGLERLIASLGQNPGRGVIARERADVRQVLHGRRPNTYRVLYVIDEAARVVTILHVRHGRREGAGLDAGG